MWRSLSSASKGASQSLNRSKKNASRSSGVAAAGTADDELDREVEFLHGEVGAAVEAAEEKLRGLFAGALDRLADDGQ